MSSGTLLGSRHRTSRLVWAGIILVLVAALRLPWIEADGGNAGLWTYGCFSTDEGHYTSGGRLAYLSGQFLDRDMGEPLLFASSWGMDWLSWLGYEVCGLSFAACRLLPMLLAVSGWLVAYWLVARRTLPWLAAAVTLIVSCNPVSLTYERIASTDVVVGSLVILAYCLATTRTRSLLLPLLAGLVLALVLSVKQTALGLLPLVVLGCLAWPQRRARALVVLAVTVVVAYGMSRGWATWQLRVHPPVANDIINLTATVLRENLDLRPSTWLVALSIFPRWPISLQLGPLIVLVTLLGVWGVGSGRWRQWLTPSQALCAGLLLYLGALVMQRPAPVRYYLPLLYFLPLLLVVIRRRLPRRRRLPTHSLAVALIGLGAVFAAYWVAAIGYTTVELRPYFYNEYNLPQRAAWGLTWFWLALGTALLAWAVYAARGGERGWASALRGVLVGLAGTALLFGNYTLAGHPPTAGFGATQVLFQVTTATVFLLLLTGGGHFGWRGWYGILLALFLLTDQFNEQWRAALPQLLTRRFVVRDAGRQLAAQLPPQAMVVGRRTSTLLRASLLRVGICNSIWNPQEFTAHINRLLEHAPGEPLYWLIDEHYFRPEFLAGVQSNLTLRVVGNVSLPADGVPQLVALPVVQVSRR